MDSRFDVFHVWCRDDGVFDIFALVLASVWIDNDFSCKTFLCNGIFSVISIFLKIILFCQKIKPYVNYSSFFQQNFRRFQNDNNQTEMEMVEVDNNQTEMEMVEVGVIWFLRYLQTAYRFHILKQITIENLNKSFFDKFSFFLISGRCRKKIIRVYNISSFWPQTWRSLVFFFWPHLNESVSRFEQNIFVFSRIETWSMLHAETKRMQEKADHHMSCLVTFYEQKKKTFKIIH